MAKVGIVGGGAFGTALACVMRRSGHAVALWAREAEVAEAINRGHENAAFLAGVRLDPGIRASADLAPVVADAAVLLLATPAQHMRRLCRELAPLVRDGTPALACAKGIEQDSLALMPQVLAEALPRAAAGVLSGPSFAREIAAGLPCRVALACGAKEAAAGLAALLGNPRFGIEPTDDLAGVALGGVMKNVVAIAAGAALGAGLGDNARATLVALGLQEAARLGAALGARAETFLGLAGAGDMMLTAASPGSRNTSFGVALGEGRRPAALLAGRREVTEGALSAAAVARLARRLGVAAPVAAAVDGMVNRGAAAATALAGLISPSRAP